MPCWNPPSKMHRTPAEIVCKCEQFDCPTMCWTERDSLESQWLPAITQITNQFAKQLKILERSHEIPLLEAMQKDLDNLKRLVNQFLWINLSLGNWSSVLRALELKVKLAREEKGDLNYWEMLNSLELATWKCSAQSINNTPYIRSR